MIFQRGLLIVMLLGFLSGGAEALAPPRLIKMVVLMSAGIKAPAASELRGLGGLTAAAKWPDGKLPLTRRGKWLITENWRLFAENNSLVYRDRNMSGAISDNTVVIYADNTTSAQAAAKAAAYGLYPPQALVVDNARRRPDTLFHPIATGKTIVDKAAVKNEILAAAGGSFAELERELSPQIKIVEQVIGPLYGGSGLVFDAGGAPRFTGRLGKAEAAANILIREYGQWPNRYPARRALTSDDMRAVMELHAHLSNLRYGSETYARAHGGPLLETMASVLLCDTNDDIRRSRYLFEHRRDERPFESMKGGVSSLELTEMGITGLEGEELKKRARNARLVIFVGEDSHLAAVAALLGLKWQNPGYAQNQTPPGGSLSFGKYRFGSGLYVKAYADWCYPKLFHGWRKVAEPAPQSGISLKHMLSANTGLSIMGGLPYRDFIKYVEGQISGR